MTDKIKTVSSHSNIMDIVFNERGGKYLGMPNNDIHEKYSPIEFITLLKDKVILKNKNLHEVFSISCYVLHQESAEVIVAHMQQYMNKQIAERIIDFLYMAYGRQNVLKKIHEKGDVLIKVTSSGQCTIGPF